jgi:hypothetical protein
METDQCYACVISRKCASRKCAARETTLSARADRSSSVTSALISVDCPAIPWPERFALATIRAIQLSWDPAAPAATRHLAD